MDEVQIGIDEHAERHHVSPRLPMIQTKPASPWISRESRPLIQGSVGTE